MMGSGQLMKVVKWVFFFEYHSPPPFLPSRLWDKYTVSRFSFAQLVEMIHTDFQGFSPCTIIVLLMLLRMPDSFIELGSGLLG